MNLKLKRTPGLYLVGFMGCGKSSVGRLLAEEIGWRFADLDEDIERQQHCSISDLFLRLGEGEFRRIESDAIQQRVQLVRRGAPTVLALGGGAFTRDENIDLLYNNGITVWLDTAYEVMKRRIEGCTHRPLARDPIRFEQLYHQRRPMYSRAEYHISIVEDNSSAAVTQILNMPFWQKS